MKKFVFRLQKVLDQRLRAEDEKKREFVKARIAYTKEKEKLDGLREELLDCNLKLVDSFSGSFKYIVKYNHISLLEDRIKDQELVVKFMEQEMDSKRAEFEKSKKDRKVIEKLKENSQNEYNTFIDKQEQKLNDEFALYGYVRK